MFKKLVIIGLLAINSIAIAGTFTDEGLDQFIEGITQYNGLKIKAGATTLLINTSTPNSCRNVLVTVATEVDKFPTSKNEVEDAKNKVERLKIVKEFIPALVSACQ